MGFFDRGAGVIVFLVSAFLLVGGLAALHWHTYPTGLKDYIIGAVAAGGVGLVALALPEPKAEDKS